jgi:hypothetical protein
MGLGKEHWRWLDFPVVKPGVERDDDRGAPDRDAAAAQLCGELRQVVVGALDAEEMRQLDAGLVEEPILAHVEGLEPVWARVAGAGVAVPATVAGSAVRPVPSARRPQSPQMTSPVKSGRSRLPSSGVASAVTCWTRRKSAALTSAGCTPGGDISHWLRGFQLRVGLLPGGRLVLSPGRGLVVVDALPLPHLPAGVARVGEDRGDRPQRPRGTGSVRVAGAVVGRRWLHAERVESAGDPGGALSGQPLREDPSDV